MKVATLLLCACFTLILIVAGSAFAQDTYLHCTDGLIDPNLPLGTHWEDIPPTGEWELDVWDDSEEFGVLDYCDYIRITDPITHFCWWFHVEYVTVTLVLEEYNPAPPEEWMYLEYLGVEEPDTVAAHPVCTWWHESYPTPCDTLHIDDWDDSNGSHVLDHCDWVILSDQDGNTYVYHVVDIAIDIAVTDVGPSSTERSTLGRIKAVYK